MTSHYCHHDQRRDRCTDRNYDTLTVALPCLNCFPHTLTVGLPTPQRNPARTCIQNAQHGQPERCVVLSIGKLGRGQEGYYLHTVAEGVEDYYVGRGEAPGRWLGTMTGELGLEGQIAAEDLRQVLAGTDPISGRRLARSGQHRVPGFDLTFCAPKSASVIWGARRS
ncbi:MAG: relaxase domain-containing protein [Acidimicrobiia bacterium]|nr:relaxase domain-containing protein [Acidimicrobiia bacterium]